MTSLSRHWERTTTSEPIYSGGTVAMSHDGSLTFLWNDKSVTVVDFPTGKKLHTLDDEEGAIVSFDTHPSDNLIATVFSNGIVQLLSWNAELDFSLERKWSTHTLPVTAIRFDTTGRLIATSSVDGTLKVWDSLKGYCTHSLRLDSIATHLAWGNGSTALVLFAGCHGGELVRFDLQSKGSIQAKAHVGPLSSLECIRDTVFSAGNDRTMSSWSTLDLSKFRTVLTEERIHSIQRNTKTKNIMTLGDKKGLRQWKQDKQSRKMKVAVTTNLMGVESQHMRIAKNMILVCTEHQDILLFDLETISLKTTWVGRNDQIIDIIHIERSNEIVVATNSSRLYIADANTLLPKAFLSTTHPDQILAIAVSPDGNTIVTGSKDATSHIHVKDDESSIKYVVKAKGHTSAVTAIAFLDNKRFVTGAADKTMKLWQFERETVECLSSVIAHTKDINGIELSQNSKFLLSCSQDKTAKLWSVENNELQKIGEFQGHKRGVWKAVFSPVDKVIATASADSTIKLWSLSTFTCLQTLEGHVASVLNLSFLNAGLQLVSSGADSLVKAWVIKTGECVFTSDLDEDEAKVWALTPMGQSTDFVVGDSHGKVQIYADISAKIYDEKRLENQEFIEKDQALRNMLREGKFDKAARKALDLGHPRRLFDALQALVVSSWKDASPKSNCLLPFAQSLTTEETRVCLGFIADWNTRPRSMIVAQCLLNAIVSATCTTDLARVPSLKQQFESILAYSKRHESRCDQLRGDVALCDVLLHSSGDVSHSIFGAHSEGASQK